MKTTSASICFLLIICSLVPILQAQETVCLSKLIPCLEYINSNKNPSKNCCDPLNSLIRSDPKCLCNLLGGSTGKQEAAVNITRALLLPAKCGEKVTAASCRSLPKTKDSTILTTSAYNHLLLNTLSLIGAVVFQVILLL